MSRASSWVVLCVSLCACSCSSDEGGAGSGTGGSGGTGVLGGGGGAPSGGGSSGASGSGGGAGAGGSAGAATGDRYVTVDGADNGDCAVNPCKTFAYAGTQMKGGEVLVLGDGTYDQPIGTSTFPTGSAGAFTVIRAAHDDGVTITGELSLYQNADFFLELRGLRFEGPDTKSVAGGSVRFVRATFVGGPPTGNTVSFGVGTNDFQPGAWDVLCEDCVFRGMGGRYAALVYRGSKVTLRRAVARKDGGWGLGSSSATGSEPEGVIMFYETKDSSCEQCVALDSLKLSHSSAEALGALIQNSHTDQHTNVVFSECYAVSNDFSGIAFEGNGSVGTVSITDCLSAKNSKNGVTANVAGNIALTRVGSLSNQGAGVASYGSASVSLNDCKVSGNAGQALDGVSGSTSGGGPKAIDLSKFDSARLRAELCDRAGVTRGLCATSTSFQDYLKSFE